MKLRIVSKGLHSTFIYSPEYRFLLDAGEGVATQLGDSIYSINRIFLSHAHADHIAGLLTMLYIRKRAQADVISIYYPKNTPRISQLRKFMGDLPRTEWIPVTAGDTIEIGKRHFMRVFVTSHIDNSWRESLPWYRRLWLAFRRPEFSSLGYSFVEKRTRLKSDYQGKSKAEISEVIRRAQKQGVKPELNEDVEKVHFAFTGDTAPLPDSVFTAIGRPDTLIHDVTYLSAADRENAADGDRLPRHAVLEEALVAAARFGARQLIGIHLSHRYAKEWSSFNQSVPDRVILIEPSGEGKWIDF